MFFNRLYSFTGVPILPQSTKKRRRSLTDIITEVCMNIILCAPMWFIICFAIPEWEPA